MTINFFVTCNVKKKKEHIGLRIKKIRAYKGLKQEDLAKSIGKTRSLISHFERTGLINKYTLVEIARALEIDVSILDSDSEFLNETMEEKTNVLRTKDIFEEIIEKQKIEIKFLKETINHQWSVINELMRKNNTKVQKSL